MAVHSRNLKLYTVCCTHLSILYNKIIFYIIRKFIFYDSPVHSSVFTLCWLYVAETCSRFAQRSRSVPKKFQQDDTLVQYFVISCKSLYMFRVKHSPIIRSLIKLYLQNLVLANTVWPAVVNSVCQHQIL
jgi:hypothetical protein